MILDRVANLVLTDADEAARFNELRRLDEIGEGLRWLAGQVAQVETAVFSEFERQRGVSRSTRRFSMMGKVPGLSPAAHALVTSSFHWYATSACNYVRTIGWLAHGAGKNQLDAYMNAVMLEVVLWRNKVAAHFAFSDPRTGGPQPDTDADFVAVALPVSFTERGFVVGNMNVALTAQGVSSTSRTGMEWCLTETHAKLTERYWREGFDNDGPRSGTTVMMPVGEAMITTDLGSPDVDITVRFSGLGGGDVAEGA